MMPAARIAFDSRETLTISIIWAKPRAGSPTRWATAPPYVTSAVAMEREPSLSLSRLIVHAFLVPSGRYLGTRNMARPRVPPGAPSGRASVRATSALALEQNHLSPHRRQAPPASRRATVVEAPTSEPPVRSVIHCVPCASASKSVVVRRGRYAACSVSLP